MPALALLLLCTIPLARALNNGVGRTPAMGWNRWASWSSGPTAEGEVRSGRTLSAFRGLHFLWQWQWQWQRIHLLSCHSDVACAGQSLESMHTHAPMRSWNFFRCNINETLIREVADAMVANGLRDAGFQYVNIGGSWEARLREARPIRHTSTAAHGIL